MTGAPRSLLRDARRVILGAVRRVNAGAISPQQARTEIEAGLLAIPQVDGDAE